MTETILLLIFAALIFVLTIVVRRAVASRKLTPVSRRAETVLRVVLCLLFGFIAHALYSKTGSSWGAFFWLNVLFGAAVIYCVAHVADGLLLTREGKVS